MFSFILSFCFIHSMDWFD